MAFWRAATVDTAAATAIKQQQQQIRPPTSAQQPLRLHMLQRPPDILNTADTPTSHSSKTDTHPTDSKPQKIRPTNIQKSLYRPTSNSHAEHKTPWKSQSKVSLIDMAQPLLVKSGHISSAVDSLYHGILVKLKCSIIVHNCYNHNRCRNECLYWYLL